MIKNLLNKLIKLNFVRKIVELNRPDYFILYYHRVVKDNEINQNSGPNVHLSVKESEFEKQMYYISKNFNLVSLDDLYNSNFKCNKFSVAVTFDDGYRDNFEIAYPILKKYKVPATIYLVSKNLTGNSWSWWIELWNYINQVEKINFDNRVIKCDSYQKKYETFINLKNIIKQLNFEKQLDFFNKLTSKPQRENHDHYYLTLNQINLIKNEKLLTLGCHTHEHLCFSYFERKEIERQISECKQILEKKFNLTVKHFAYPYGSVDDINFFEHEVLKKENFSTAVLASEVVEHSIKNFYLPRICVGPFINIDDFQRKLSGFDIMIKKILNKIKK